MTVAQDMARFAVRASYDDLSGLARETLRIRILDSLGCALGALDAGVIRMLREHIADFDGSGHCTLIGGGRTAPDRAGFYNGALVRFLDFNDTYLAPGETCHPSDNFGAVLAAAEYAGGSGKDLLCALAVAYQVQCRLSDEAPVRAKGFDHTTQGSYAVAAGVSRALGLDVDRTANALAIAGTAFNALRVSRTGALSHWKGLAYPNTGFGCIHAAFLAMRGVTGPPEVFEGNKGFMEAIAGRFSIDWAGEDLERLTRTITKRYNAEVHAQPAIEGVLELRSRHDLPPSRIRRIEVETFDVAYNIIGGGEEGAKTEVQTKEQADHSLPYMIAAALLDGDLMPPQYTPERIARRDVQDLLRKVSIRPSQEYSRRFPAEMPYGIRIFLEGGPTLETEKSDYQGFVTRPMSWEAARDKFELLAGRRRPAHLLAEITEAVRDLEHVAVRDFARLLGETYQT